VKELTGSRDVVIAGSASILHALARADLVDEYRILLFPTALGRGTKLFPGGTAPTHLRLLSAQPVGQAVLLRYERPPR
jgi:dihydrofolate reductase